MAALSTTPAASSSNKDRIYLTTRSRLSRDHHPQSDTPAEAHQISRGALRAHISDIEANVRASTRQVLLYDSHWKVKDVPTLTLKTIKPFIIVRIDCRRHRPTDSSPSSASTTLVVRSFALLWLHLRTSFWVLCRMPASTGKGSKSLS